MSAHLKSTPKDPFKKHPELGFYSRKHTLGAYVKKDIAGLLRYFEKEENAAYFQSRIALAGHVFLSKSGFSESMTSKGRGIGAVLLIAGQLALFVNHYVNEKVKEEREAVKKIKKNPQRAREAQEFLDSKTGQAYQYLADHPYGGAYSTTGMLAGLCFMWSALQNWNGGDLGMAAAGFAGAAAMKLNSKHALKISALIFEFGGVLPLLLDSIQRGDTQGVVASGVYTITNGMMFVIKKKKTQSGDFKRDRSKEDESRFPCFAVNNCATKAFLAAQNNSHSNIRAKYHLNSMRCAPLLPQSARKCSNTR